MQEEGETNSIVEYNERSPQPNRTGVDIDMNIEKEIEENFSGLVKKKKPKAHYKTRYQNLRKNKGYN